MSDQTQALPAVYSAGVSHFAGKGKVVGVGLVGNQTAVGIGSVRTTGTRTTSLAAACAPPRNDAWTIATGLTALVIVIFLVIARLLGGLPLDPIDIVIEVIGIVVLGWLLRWVLWVPIHLWRGRAMKGATIRWRSGVYCSRCHWITYPTA